MQYEGSNSRWEIFSHHFVLKKIRDVWIIVNDTFRGFPRVPETPFELVGSVAAATP